MATNKNTEALPIEAFHNDIMGCDSPYVIVEAETGSGKSTMVPQWYHSLGMRVLVTEPLIETVIGTSEYVAELMGCELGSTVGYRTGSNRCDSPQSDILFCTDGLALIRELSGHNRFDVLVIDELHEWNTNQSTLEAWAWKHLLAGDSPFKKIVVLSATLASEELSRKRGNAPVFKVPGRQFPIEDRRTGSSLEADVKALVAENFDVLVFQPGEAEIKKTIAALEGCGAELIPFYGKLDRAEKNKAYRSYDRPKVVVSTNALETGRTLLPSTGRNLAVVDSGMERRVELVDGIEGLYLKPIAKARGQQRRGRTGRVGPGVYIDHCPSSDRTAYPVPEILRTRLDQTVLRLACHGYDATELPFFHDLDRGVIADAKRALGALGAMREDGSVTQTGRLMAKLPVSVQFARMVVEAEKRGVVDDVLTIAAILEAESLRDRTGAWRQLTREQESDLLAELDVWQAAQNMRHSEMRDAGIFGLAYQRAKDNRRKLVDALKAHRVRFGSSGKREDILKSCVAGMVDHLYRSNGYGEYQNGGYGTRQKARESVVVGNPDWITGMPKDIQFKNRRGRLCTLNLVSQVTKVDPMWLTEVAPQLASEKTGLNPRYESSEDVIVSTTQTYFNGQMVREQTVADGEHPDAAKVFARWLSVQSGLPTVPGYSSGQTLEATLRSNAARQERARQLNIRTGEQTFQVFSSDEMFERFVAALSGARRILEVVRPEALALPTLDEDKVVEVLSNQPDTIDVLGSNLVVEYRAPSYGTVYAPRVKLSDEVVKANGWIRLPDEGVRLPGGRSVEVVVSFGYYTTIADTNIPSLKAKVREHLNREQWDRWTKPEIELPDLSADDAVIPFITETYGACVVKGDELKAYGTIQATRYWSSDPITWRPVWYRNLDEAQRAAEVARQEFIKNLAEAKAAKARAEAEAEAQREREKAEAIALAELNAAKVEVQASQREIQKLQSDKGWWDLGSLRYEAEELSRKWLPSTLEGNRQLAVEASAIVARVKASLSELASEREETARVKAEAEAGERAELAVILEHVNEDCSDDLATARSIRRFAEEAVRGAGGSRNSVRSILTNAYNAGYGWWGRRDDVFQALPGLREVLDFFEDHGFSRISRAWELDMFLTGAIAWIDQMNGPVKPTTRGLIKTEDATKEANSVETAKTTGKTFTHSAQRDFSCDCCGKFARATKSDFKAWGAGSAITLSCVSCGSGVAKPEVSISSEPSQGGEVKSEEAPKVSLADLTGKWGKR